jgi:glutaredoxin
MATETQISKKTVLFLRDDCEWCKDTKKILDDVGAPYTELDVSKNPIAKAIAKKACDGREMCALIKGEVITKFDKKKIADAILGD